MKLECLRLLVTLPPDPARMRLISSFVDTYLILNADEEQQFQSELYHNYPLRDWKSWARPCWISRC